MNRPSLILLVGIPGSGKTTYAEKYIKENPCTVHLSSDKIRAELWGNEDTQGDNNEVFSLMQSRAIETLNNGQSVVYDATNITQR
jgi:predicted kinase